MVVIIPTFHKLLSCDPKLVYIMAVQISKIKESIIGFLPKREHKKILENSCKMTTQK